MDVHDELKKLLSHLEEFPEPSSVEKAYGADTPEVGAFRRELDETARVAADATRKVMAELADMDEVIRAALDDLANHDAELAASADRFEAFLDSAGEYPEQQSDSSVGDGSANLRSQTPGRSGAGRA